MLEFIQTHGQATLFAAFIAILIFLELFIVFAHPKATCCTSQRECRDRSYILKNDHLFQVFIPINLNVTIAID
jgi:hypothetical protein